MINDNFKFNPQGSAMAQDNMGYRAAKGQGFIGSNAYNYSVNSFNGLSARDAEINFHKTKMSLIKKPSSQRKELKRHIKALQDMGTSNADGSSIMDTIKNAAGTLLPAKEPEVEEGSKTILGMPPVLFYSILGVLALTIIVLIVKLRK